MQPVVHRPRGKRNVVVSRCSRPFVAGCGRVQRLTICGGGLDLAGCTQVAYREWTASGQVSRIGVMIAGNSGRPGGSIYKPWFSSPQQRLQGVHPGHRTQEHSILSSWLVGSERPAPHISLAENGIQFPRQTYENMEDRFLRCLHRKWGMVENDVKAFKGFIAEDGRPITDPSRWPDDVRQRWLATMQGVDYVNTQHAGDYEEAWTLPDADLCVDESDGGPSGWRVFKLDKIVRTTLIFVAGPNASNGWGHSMMGSVLRTRNKRCIDEASSTSNVELRRTASGLEVNNIEKAAPFFVSCVRNAMRAGLDAAIEAGIDVIVLARISGGIYAGAWHRAMTRDFYRKLVEDLLEESVAITVYDIDPVPNRDTASGQDAAPVPNRDTASGQHEPKIEPGSAHDGSASGQISRDPPPKRRRMDKGGSDPDAYEWLPEEDLLEWWEETEAMMIEDEDVYQGVDAVPGVRIPRSMPRGAFFQSVIMPWVDENVHSFIAL